MLPAMDMTSSRMPQAATGRRLDGWAILLVALAGLFFVVQNLWLHIGGEIAFVKVLWLMTAIYFWFVLPPALARHREASSALKTIYLLFWGSMLGRAGLELYMMYGPQNWHPYLGIGHNLFSLGLVAVLMGVWHRRLSGPPVLRVHLFVTMAMLGLESFFAWYMLNNVRGDGPIYYVPATAAHQTVLVITGVAVTVLASYYLVFIRRLWPRVGRAA